MTASEPTDSLTPVIPLRDPCRGLPLSADFRNRLDRDYRRLVDAVDSTLTSPVGEELNTAEHERLTSQVDDVLLSSPLYKDASIGPSRVVAIVDPTIHYDPYETATSTDSSYLVVKFDLALSVDQLSAEPANESTLELWQFAVLERLTTRLVTIYDYAEDTRWIAMEWVPPAYLGDEPNPDNPLLTCYTAADEETPTTEAEVREDLRESPLDTALSDDHQIEVSGGEIGIDTTPDEPLIVYLDLADLPFDPTVRLHGDSGR